MSSGRYLECDECGEHTLTSNDQMRVSTFRKRMRDNWKWVSVTVAGKGVYDFCCKECYAEWKRRQ